MDDHNTGDHPYNNRLASSPWRKPSDVQVISMSRVENSQARLVAEERFVQREMKLGGPFQAFPLAEFGFMPLNLGQLVGDGLHEALPCRCVYPTVLHHRFPCWPRANVTGYWRRQSFMTMALRICDGVGCAASRRRLPNADVRIRDARRGRQRVLPDHARLRPPSVRQLHVNVEVH